MPNLLEMLGVESTIQDRVKAIDYDKMTSDEQATYRQWLNEMETKSITVSDILEYAQSIKTSLVEEIAKLGSSPEYFEKNIYVKGRLENISLIEKMMTDRLKAQAELYRQMSKETAPKSL